MAVAVKPVMPRAPVKLRFKVPALAKVPVPAKAAVMVRVPLLVKVMVVTVTLGIENVPVNPWALVSKVWTPEPAVKVLLLVIPPLKVMAELPELFQVAPAVTVTKPVKVLAPVDEEMVKLPLVPVPILVAPVTVMAKAPMVKVVPSPTERMPPTVTAPAVVVFPVPLVVKLLKLEAFI